MQDIALRMEHVYKRFRRGEMHDSLRDLIPALARRILSRQPRAMSKREFWALQDIDFEVRKGEAFAIIGHNGAGKSTILKILSRIMRPTEGRMTIQGRLSALIEVSAGFHQDLTGRENIYLNGTILGMTRREIDSKLDQIVAFSGLDDFIDTPVKRYSSGMFARLGFSVAAHVDPDVLIVDEVLSVGDFVFQQKCLTRMTEVIKSGTTVLFVSHNLRAVADLCSRGLLLDHGRVAAIGDTAHVINRYMDSIRADRHADDGKIAHIASVVVRRGTDECVQFETGERARVDIDVVAKDSCKRVAVVLYLTDDSNYIVFDTSTERLGHSSYDLRPGDRLKCSFDLELNMAYGSYHVCVTLFRYDIDSAIDQWEPAATFFVGSQLKGFRGIVNCKPVVVREEILRGESQPESEPAALAILKR